MKPAVSLTCLPIPSYSKGYIYVPNRTHYLPILLLFISPTISEDKSLEIKKTASHF